MAGMNFKSDLNMKKTSLMHFSVTDVSLKLGSSFLFGSGKQSYPSQGKFSHF